MTRNRGLRLTLAALALAGGHAAADPGPTAHRVEVLHSGLDRPWALAFLPGGEAALITGRGGRLWHWQAEGNRLIPLSGVPQVDDRGQGGLLDVAVDPGFADNGRIWLAWAGAVPGARRGETATHLGHARLNMDAGRIEGLEAVFAAAPAMNSPAHFGARIVFHDGHLYLGLGDRAQKDFGPDHVAQRLDSENGAVVRLRLDGSVPDDNPFVGTRGARPAIWSYGHRNIQAMAVHPDSGAIWAAEHGENGGDEINILTRGGNHGWPLAAHGTTYRGGMTFAPPHQPGDGFVAPVWHSPPGRAAPFPPSGMAFYTGAAFESWQGDLLLGNLGQRYLGRFVIEGETPVLAERLLDGQGWRIRDVAVGPADGFVYVLSDGEGAVLARLVPEAAP